MSREKKVKRSKTDMPDPNLDYFQLEEQEARSRDSHDDEILFRKTCAEIQRNMKRILDLKLQRKSTAEVSELRVETSLLFLALKKINRLDKHRLKVAKDAVNEKKQKVDNFHLQLQNLTYEVMHLQKEVTKCMEFRRQEHGAKSRDEEIDLVPVEEFRREAPADVLKRDVTDGDPHQLTLARLQWELVQRKQLAKRLKGLEAMRASYEREIERKRECLEGIQPTLQAVLEAAQPLQADLGLPLQAHQAEHASAHFLARPLYVLYVQASAYREAYGGDCFEVSMEGSVEEAKALLETPEEKQEEDSGGESDQEEPSAGKRHRRLERGGSSSGASSSLVAKCIQKHPLTVVLTLQHKGYKLQITFTYIIPLHIVTVVASVAEPHGVSSGVSAWCHGPLTQTHQGRNVFCGVDSSEWNCPVMSPSTILDNLFGSDNGLSSPNPANHFQLKKNGLGEFSSVVSETGKAYRWAQRLSGLEFLQGSGGASTAAPVARHEVGRAFVQELVGAVGARFSARVSLYEQLLSLEKGVVSVPARLVDHFPCKVTSVLKQWTQVTHAAVEGHPSYREMEELGLVQGSELVYQAVLCRGSAMVRALVLLGDNYPQEAPLFLLTLQLREEQSSRDDDAVKELERELNVHSVEQGHGTSVGEHLLTYQLQQLLVCMDVLLESLCEAHQDAPREFSRDKVLARSARGPSRSRPYKFLPKPGIFTQRT
ncbi:THO complex subunit 5 isoform X2 [Haemaphysalis longicornis]